MFLVVLGIVLTVAGVGCWFYGSYMSSNVFLLWDALWKHGMINPGGLWKTAGSILIVVGIVLLVLGLKERGTGFSRKNDDDDDDQFDLDDDFD